MALARRAGLLQLGLDNMEAGSGAGGQLWHVWEPSRWPTGPRIGSLAGATVGTCRGHPVSVCLFCCCLQPSPRLVIGQSSPSGVVVWGCCPASSPPSLHFRLLQLQAALRPGPGLAFDQPRPAFSSSMRSYPITHTDVRTLAPTCAYSLLPRARLTVSDGIDSLAVSRGHRESV